MIQNPFLQHKYRQINNIALRWMNANALFDTTYTFRKIQKFKTAEKPVDAKIFFI
jgi:hypothetical protein